MSAPVIALARQFDILLIPRLDRLSRDGGRRLESILKVLREHRTRVLSLADQDRVRAGHALDELDLATNPVTPGRYLLDEMRRLEDAAERAALHRRLARGREAAARERASA